MRAHTCTHTCTPRHTRAHFHTHMYTHAHPRWHLSQSGRSPTARSQTFQLAGLQAAPRLHPIFLIPKLPNSHHPLSSDGLFHPKSGSWAKFTELLMDRRMPLVTRTESFPWHVCPLGKLPILGSGPWPPLQGLSPFHEQKGDSKTILWRYLEKHGFKAVRQDNRRWGARPSLSDGDPRCDGGKVWEPPSTLGGHGRLEHLQLHLHKKQ